MSDCNNNCEAVAGLNEAAANIVQYRNLINSWLNGAANATVNVAGVNTPTLLKLVTDLRTRINQMPQSILQQNGGIAIDENGKLYINFATMPDSILYGLLQKIVLEDGGLAFNNQGKMYVDFASMPTGKFDEILETFRKGLRLPKYLNGNTNFYVNKSHANAGDSLEDEERGTESLPFATIRAAVNNIMNNYNIGPYTANIIVSDDLYEETVILGDYNRSTGRVLIKPANMASGYVRMKTLFSGYAARPIHCSGGVWDVYYLKLDDTHSYTGDDYLASAPYISYYGAYVSGGSLSLYAPELKATLSGVANVEKRVGVFYADGGSLAIRPDDTRPAKVILNYSVTGTEVTGRSVFTSTNANTNMILGYSRTASAEGKKLYISGAFDVVMVIRNKGTFTTESSTNLNLVPVVLSGGSVSGKRYQLNTGGTCYTGGRGPDFFPGDVAGTVDASTFCWYV